MKHVPTTYLSGCVPFFAALLAGFLHLGAVAWFQPHVAQPLAALWFAAGVAVHGVTIELGRRRMSSFSSYLFEEI